MLAISLALEQPSQWYNSEEMTSKLWFELTALFINFSPITIL